MKSELRYRRSIGLYTFIQSIFNLADKMYGAVFILHMNTSGLNPMQIGSVFGIASIALAIFDYPTGVIADKFGRKRTGALGFIIEGVGAIVFALSNTFLFFVLSQIIIALGMALISGAPVAWIIDVMKETDNYSKKDSVFAKIRSISQAFAVIGAIISVFLVKLSFSIVLIIVGVLTIIVGLVSLLYLPDNKGELKGDNIWENLFHSTVDFLKNKNMKILLLKSCFGHGAFLIFILSWQIYLIEDLGRSFSWIGILLAIFMGLVMLGTLITTRLTKRLKSIEIAKIGNLLKAIGFLIIVLVPNLYFYLIGVSLFEIGFGMNLGAGAWFHDYVPSKLRSTYYSGHSALISLIGVFISFALGAFATRFGYRYLWLVASILQFCSFIMLIYISNMKPISEEKEVLAPQQ